MKKSVNIKNLKPFKKGYDPRRNMKGPQLLPDLKTTIAKILSKEEKGVNGLEEILIALYERAKKGDVRAAQELLDRGFGKSAQQIDLKTEMQVIKGITFDDTD